MATDREFDLVERMVTDVEGMRARIKELEEENAGIRKRAHERANEAQAMVTTAENDRDVARARVKKLEAELAQEKEATVFCPDCRRVVKRTRKLSIHHALQARVKVLEARLRWRGSDRLAREVRALIDRGVIDGRSLAADALLDYEQGNEEIIRALVEEEEIGG